MAISRLCFASLIALLLAVPAPGGEKKKDPNEFPQVVQPKKKDKPEPTQVLPVAKEPPRAVVAETTRLDYVVTPLSGKGLLSQQTRDALKWLLSTNHGNIVKLRAFVAGTGDVRRIQDIVSEMFDRQAPGAPGAQCGPSRRAAARRRAGGNRSDHPGQEDP